MANVSKSSSTVYGVSLQLTIFWDCILQIHEVVTDFVKCTTSLASVLNNVKTKRFHNLEADVKINKQWGIFPTFEVTVLIFFKSPRLQYPGVGNKSPGTDENTVFEFKILDRAQLHTFTYNFINTQLHTIKHCMCVISSAV